VEASRPSAAKVSGLPLKVVFENFDSYLVHWQSASKEDDEADDLRMDLDDESETTSPVGKQTFRQLTEYLQPGQ